MPFFRNQLATVCLVAGLGSPLAVAADCFADRSIPGPLPPVLPAVLVPLNADETVHKTEREIRHEGHIVGYTITYLHMEPEKPTIKAIFNIDGQLLWLGNTSDPLQSASSLVVIGNLHKYACQANRRAAASSGGVAGGGDEANPFARRDGARLPEVDPDLIGEPPAGRVIITDLPSGGGTSVPDLFEIYQQQR